MILGFYALMPRYGVQEAAAPLLKRPHNLLVLGWLTSITTSALLAPDPLQAFLGSYWGQMGVLQWTLAAVLFMAAQTVTLQRQHWSVLSWGVGALLVLTFLESIGLRPLFWLPEATAYPAATIGQRGHLAGLYALVAGVAMHRRALPTLLMAGVGIALCNNTSALIGYVFAGTFFLIIQRSWFKPIFLSMICTVALFFTVTKSDELCRILSWNHCINTKDVGSDNVASLRDRLSLWQANVGMWQVRPFLGWGDEQYAAHWPEYLPSAEADRLTRLFIGAPPDATLQGQFPVQTFEKSDGTLGIGMVNLVHPHNTLLEELQSHGLLGFGLMIAFVVVVYRKFPNVLLGLSGYAIYLLAWFPVFAVLPITALLAGTLCNSRAPGGHAATREDH